MCVSENGGGVVGDACGGSLQGCSPELYCFDDDGDEEGICLRDCRKQTQEGCAVEEFCLDLQDPENPARGICLPKDAPPVEDVVQVVEDSGGGDSGPDASSDVADEGNTLPPPPIEPIDPPASSSGGCVSAPGSHSGIGHMFLLFLFAILVLRRPAGRGLA